MPQAQIDECVAIMKAAGMNATVSSIHINGWFGEHNKLEGARAGSHASCSTSIWTRHAGAGCISATRPTTSRCSRQCPYSVGVANIARFVPQLRHLPRHVTSAERGDGFVQLADQLLTQAK